VKELILERGVMKEKRKKLLKSKRKAKLRVKWMKMKVKYDRVMVKRATAGVVTEALRQRKIRGSKVKASPIIVVQV
jgi:hypothetical protein